MRTVIRYALVLLGGFFAGSRIVGAGNNWRDWHESAITDPSAADLYRTNFWFDVTIVILTLGITGLIYRLLRPTPQQPADPEL